MPGMDLAKADLAEKEKDLPTSILLQFTDGSKLMMICDPIEYFYFKFYDRGCQMD